MHLSGTARLENISLISQISGEKVAIWLAAFVAVATLLAVLTIAVVNTSILTYDAAVIEWLAGWNLPGLDTFFAGLSSVTGSGVGLVYGPVGIALLLLLGKTRAALVFAVFAVTIVVVATIGDQALGEIVDRGRPLAASDNPTPAYPSGHVFASTVFLGFIAFLAVYYRLKTKLLVPLLGLLAAVLLLVGLARVYEQAHWPTDVAAGYLLGFLWLMVLAPLFIFIRSTKWMHGPKYKEVAALSCETCRIEGSLASVVVLDPERGTATKVYKPPPVVKLLYWLAFQARFPYRTNTVALLAAAHRRRIAGLLTAHRFGKDLVAPVTAVNCVHGGCTFVTEYIPGEIAENDDETKQFLSQVVETFAAAGLSVCQVSPRNPHAHYQPDPHS